MVADDTRGNKVVAGITVVIAGITVVIAGITVVIADECLFFFLLYSPFR
jgi:type IV secretory pathway VirB3-like protein